MTLPTTFAASRPPVFAHLEELARSLALAQEKWLVAWRVCTGEPDAHAVRRLEIRTKFLNDAIAVMVPTIARVTGNSTMTLHSAFAPREPLDVWFRCAPDLPPATFLRNVARYGTFNTERWWDLQRSEEEGALLAAAAEPDEPMGPVAAAVRIAAGQVPTLRAGDCAKQGSCASALEQQLFVLGIVEPYWPEDRLRWRYLAEVKAPMGQHLGGLTDRLSATRSFAFWSVAQDGTARFAFWPVSRARNHIRITPHAAIADAETDTPADCAAPRG